VGGDKWRLSFACLATLSVDSCVGLPCLYETGPGGTGWRLGRGHEGGGGLNRDTATWRLGGLQDGIRCVPGGAHSKKHTLL
jgi:hypothetical protein